MNSRWTTLTFVTLTSIVVYVFMEWLFQVTKPSFMTAMTTGERAVVLGGGTLAGVVLGGCVLFVLQMIGRWARGDRAQRACLTLARLPAALVVGAMGLLLIDNFTYTVWGWGIQTTSTFAQRGAYSLLCVGLAVGAYLLVSRWVDPRLLDRSRWMIGVARYLPGVCVIGAALAAGATLSTGVSASLGPSRGDLERAPNVLLFSGDGINAGHMSTYGYQRPTSPAIDRLARQALVAENNFPNAAHTGASIASTLTGRLPTETGLIYPPDILRGEDAYQHLPAILKRHGYSTVSITLRHYGDAYDLNLRGGFDESNFRSQRTYRIAWLLSGSFGHAATYLTETMIDRLAGRLQHLAGGRRMNEAVAEVTLEGTGRENDSERVAGLVDFLNSGRQPFFAHIHLLATHGPDFAPRQNRFTGDRGHRGEWDIDTYDDAIRTVDNDFARIETELRGLGLWDETLVVFFSDHGMEFATDVRTPLLFRFPGGQNSRRIAVTTSNLDIAPTILEYLGAPVPVWMSGGSLLGADPDRRRAVLSAKKTRTGGERTALGWRLDPRQVGPPFYSLGSVTAIVCQRAFRLDLDNRRVRVTDVEGHSEPCAPGDLPKAEEVESLMVDHLRDNGYDVAGLELPLPKRFSGIRRRDR